MNKIISANINGFVFQIDELAYTKLKAYLDMIRKKVSNSEIAQDIENRIAELFNEKLKDGRQAIFDADVDEVMQQIGKPEEFASEEQEEKSNAQTGAYEQDRKKSRRLYRDADDKVIGGVCSGISAYFGIDPVIIRLAFAASFFFFGTGIILYILLMIAIPKAISPEEKLEMHGKPVDYQNISRAVEMEFKDAYKRYKPEVKTGFERFLEIAVRIGMIMLIIFIVSVFIPGCFGILTGIGIASWSLPALNAYLFTTQSESIIILIGLVLFLVIPIFGAGYSILRFAFKLKPMNSMFRISLSVLWFIGFCMLAFSTYTIGKQFSSSNKITSYDTLQTGKAASNVLIIRSNHDENHSEFVIKDEDGDRHVHIRSQEDLKEAIDQEIGRNVELNITRGFGTAPVVKVVRYANGENKGEAMRNAEKIDYHYSVRDSVVYLDESFSRGDQQLWRNQKVRILIEVPMYYKLLIDSSCRRLLDVSGHDKDKFIDKYLTVGEGGILVE